MPKYGKAQKEWASAVLYHHVSGLDSQNPDHPMEEIQVKGSSYSLLDQLKARVITGETLTDQDLFNAKNTLDVNDQAELAAFLEN